MIASTQDTLLPILPPTQSCDWAVPIMGSLSSPTLNLQKLPIILVRRMKLETEVLERYTMQNFAVNGKLLSSVYMSTTTEGISSS
ncbi:hypothetical protein Patl1_15147 [Pistacia atlantica]|uniref:Uncharacterized protein n=1 Tax=Pistacia atlantica TaxID=434234 RepID=A0ACC1B8V0_9ROSI|nr:hypothetical protein Patl1_15147 [Pistacia atlantica]